MSEPTFVPLSTGDVNDDDGQIIDDFFKPNPIPPSAEGTAAVVHKEAEPKKPTRLISNSLTIPLGATLLDPVQVAWSDTDRESLQIFVIGAAADFIYFADETTKLSQITPTGSRMSTRANSSLLPLTFSGFTGPLFVKTDITPMTANLTIEIVSITK